MPPATQFADDPLRLAQRIGAHEDAAIRGGVECAEQPVDLAARIGVTEDGQAEGRLRHEDVAGHGSKRQAGGIGRRL
jgi:hypothetical protein